MVRRAGSARGLLLAAAVATVICTVLLTGSVVYARAVLDAGARNAVDTADRAERSLLLRGPLQQATFAERDAAVRARTSPRFGGVPSQVHAAGYAAGRQLDGETGRAVADADGRVFAGVMFLEGLDRHAELTSGAWARAGATPVQATLGQAAAATLGVDVGDRLPITDRFTGRVSEVAVVGIWRPRRAADPYWELYPYVSEGVAPRSSTYGPVVLDRADFLAGYTKSASAAWIVEPLMIEAGADRLQPVVAAAEEAVDKLPSAVGFDSAGVAVSRTGALLQRMRQADLVARSALVTPMLLLAVLGGYTLLLVALLLGEQRSAETALLRARGAGRMQLAVLAGQEALLVVAPAALLAPWLGAAAVRLVDGGTRPVSVWPDRYAWAVAVLVAAACAAAMVLPALRTGGTYVAALAARSRPVRRAAVQRAGVDLALIAVAAVGWWQLQQYSTPVAGDRRGGLQIDPLLAAGPTLGVLAGAAVGLRLLPLLTRVAQRQVDRRAWVAGTLGMWQAGRRPHAGPVLLLALAVAVSTLAWCMAATAQRSTVDQSDHAVGADLRLVQHPGGRIDPALVAALPGVSTALPSFREEQQLGPTAQPGMLVALDAGSAGSVLRMRPDLADGTPSDPFDRLAAARVPSDALPLPAGAFTGSLTVTGARGPARIDAIVVSAGGDSRAVALGESTDGRTVPFSVDLPASPDGQRLVGFVVNTTAEPATSLTWRLDGLRAGGAPLDLGGSGGWGSRGTEGAGGSAKPAGDDVQGRYQVPRPGSGTLLSGDGAVAVRVAAGPMGKLQPVPVLATDTALAALRAKVGDTATAKAGPFDVDVRLVGTVRALPGTTQAAALFADLPSLASILWREAGAILQTEEWWLSTRPDGHAAAAAAATRIDAAQLLDRRESARAAVGDPYGRGPRTALFAAALGAVLLAVLGLAVDVRATARRRAGELAVLNTLGAAPRLLAGSLVIEQALLAVLGLAVGALVGVAVAGLLATLVILSPSAARPVPAPILDIPWWSIAASVTVLAAVALLLSALTARRVRRRLAATELRIGTQG